MKNDIEQKKSDNICDDLKDISADKLVSNDSGSDELNITKGKVAELEKEISELKNEAKKNWDLYLTAKADAENINKRALKDIEKATKYSIESFALEILNVADSIEYGLNTNRNDDKNDIILNNIIKGMHLTYNMLIDTLNKFEIRMINPINKKFNPNEHEAISVIKNNTLDENTVLNVVQVGYSYYDRVLRHAKVIVSLKD